MDTVDRRTDWRARALCAQADPELFFPDEGRPAGAARAVCARCPVTADCLQWALQHDERFGIWGGTTARERAEMPRPARVRTARGSR